MPPELRSESEELVVHRRLVIGLIVGVVTPTLSAVHYVSVGSFTSAIIAAGAACGFLAVIASIWLLGTARLPTHLLLAWLAGLVIVAPAIAKTGTDPRR